MAGLLVLFARDIPTQCLNHVADAASGFHHLFRAVRVRNEVADEMVFDGEQRFCFLNERIVAFVLAVPFGKLYPAFEHAHVLIIFKPVANRHITGVGQLPRLIGWFCWKYKLAGYMHYAVDYTDSETTHSPWDNTGSRWATFFYPTDKTWDPDLGYWQNSAKWDWAIPSIRLMQIRDGFEDYEYMRMLHRWIQLAKRHGRHERNDALIKQAESMLAVEDHFVGDFITYTHRAEEMIEARRRVGDMIESLRRDVTGQQYQ